MYACTIADEVYNTLFNSFKNKSVIEGAGIRDQIENFDFNSAPFLHIKRGALL